MPLASISLARPRTPEARRRLADAVHGALVESVGSPSDDRFQVVHTHGENLIFDRGYLGIGRTDDFVLVQVLVFPGKPIEQKKAIIAAIADRLHTGAGVRREDVMVVLHEVPKENWSFGNGVAQHAG